jgi:hypothetical protein
VDVVFNSIIEGDIHLHLIGGLIEGLAQVLDTHQNRSHATRHAENGSEYREQCIG